jgi:hypothetical protein
MLHIQQYPKMMRKSITFIKVVIMKPIFITVSFLLFVSLIGLNSSVCVHTDVTPEAAKDMIDSDEVIIIDVREEKGLLEH